MRKGIIFLVVLSMALLTSADYVHCSQSAEALGGDISLPDDYIHRFGESVCECDLDGDGTSELVIGAPEFIPHNTGRVFIFSGQNGYLLETLIGEATGNLFGTSVACAGDVNNDGTDDLIIGAPGFDDSRGKVYVYEGSENLDFPFLDAVVGGSSGDRLGRAVSSVGDINQDDSVDVIVGAPGYQNGRGWYRIYHGGNSLKASICWDEGEHEGDSLGFALCGGRFINNDLIPDYVVASPYFDATLQDDVGRVYIMDGSSCDMLYGDVPKQGTQADEYFGYSLALADVDNNGYTDVMIGAPGHDNDEGRVCVYKGQTLLKFVNGCISGSSDDLCGYSVSSAGDANNNGIEEFLVGLPGYDSGKGQVRRYERDIGDMHFVVEITWVGGTYDREFGASVSSAPDYDGDGYLDPLIGAPFAYCYMSYDIGGKTHIYSGDNSSEKLLTFYNSSKLYIDSPEEDDTLVAGCEAVIEWHESCDYESDSVRLIFTYDGGQTWPDMIQTDNDGTYTWEVPCVDSDSCLIKICGPGIPCRESRQFTIVPGIDVTSPTSGDCLNQACSCYVEWVTNACFSLDNVLLSYTTDGSVWIEIGWTPDTGLFFWNVAGTDTVVSESCKVRVAGPGGTPVGESDFFSVYLCGDANGSGGIDIDDVVYLIQYIFNGGPAPVPCVASGDADCSGGVDIDDVVYLINYIFAGGPPPCDPDGDGEQDCCGTCSGECESECQM